MKQISATDMEFENIRKIVEVIGPPVTVSGKRFPSCGSAANYIAKEETKLGNARNRATINKELRRYVQGKRDKWIMYDRYTIGY